MSISRHTYHSKEHGSVAPYVKSTSNTVVMVSKSRITAIHAKYIYVVYNFNTVLPVGMNSYARKIKSQSRWKLTSRR